MVDLLTMGQAARTAVIRWRRLTTRKGGARCDCDEIVAQRRTVRGKRADIADRAPKGTARRCWIGCVERERVGELAAEYAQVAALPDPSARKSRARAANGIR
jgi:hypothetical protein